MEASCLHTESIDSERLGPLFFAPQQQFPIVVSLSRMIVLVGLGLDIYHGLGARMYVTNEVK